MPDARISQLPAASLPLAGDELVAVVQSGVTSQAPASAFGGGGGGDTVMAFALVNNVGDFITASHPGVDGVSWSCGEPGVYQVNFSDGWFSDAPAIAISMFENDPQVTYELIDFDQFSCTFRIYTIDDKTPFDMPFSFMACGV